MWAKTERHRQVSTGVWPGQELPSAAHPSPGASHRPPEQPHASLPAEMRLALPLPPSMHSLRRRTHFSTKQLLLAQAHINCPGRPHTGSRGLLQAPHSGCPVPNPSPRSCSPAANPLITPSRVSKEKLTLRSSDTGCEHREACSMGHRCSGSDLGFCGTSGKFINPSGHSFPIFKIGETNVLPSGVVGRFT